MPKISVGSAGRDLNLQISGSDLVGRSNESTNRSNEAIGPCKSEPDSGKQHRQSEQHENDRETKFEAVTMRLEAPKQVGDAGRVIRDLCRQGVDRARCVEELSVCAGNWSNADKRITSAQKAAKRLAVECV